MSVRLGYSLSSEEHAPGALVRFACDAEKRGFSFALISDHFHPWTPRQGHASHVWTVIGAIAAKTQKLVLGTGVTCPLIRIHPALVAQAAATAAAMMPDRFFLGLGTGENLNEHILGRHWPPIRTRQEMLEEAVKIIRMLWRGGNCNHRGRYFTLENAELFDIPERPPPIMIAAVGSKSAELAGSIGDGLISIAPAEQVVKKFSAAENGDGRPRYGQMTVCWARSDSEANQIAREWWPITAIPGKLMTELATPAEFEAVAELVREDAACQGIVCGADPEKHLAQIDAYEKAGFDHVYVHQIGPDQEGFFGFYEREILPRLR